MPRMVILLSCVMLQVCLGTVYAWSFFQTMLVRQLGWTFVETAIPFSLAIFFIGAAAAWAGTALPRLGPRKLALTGSILFCTGYFIASLALATDQLQLFYIGYGVIGGAGIGLGYVTPVATVAKWFPDRKGLATGTVVMGFGIGALLLSKLLAPVLVVYSDGDLQAVFLGLGVIFAAILLPVSLLLDDPPRGAIAPVASGPRTHEADNADVTARECLMTPQFFCMWIVFFCNIAAGISVISFQSPLLQDVWGLADPLLEPETLAAYGATLIAVSSVCNGVGRLLWGLLSDRLGRTTVFRILLGSQMVVFGVLMTEQNPWVFSILVCYVLLCFGGGFATMPSFIVDVFGNRRMSTLYGAILTAWAAAGIIGPLYVGYLKDQYPDRAVTYCFLIGIFMLGAGYIFTYLLNDDRVVIRRPTVEGTLRYFNIPVPRT